jgi:hypothetical protein
MIWSNRVPDDEGWGALKAEGADDARILGGWEPEARGPTFGKPLRLVPDRWRLTQCDLHHGGDRRPL